MDAADGTVNELWVDYNTANIEGEAQIQIHHDRVKEGETWMINLT